ncbi:MAG: lysine--tRNA ligase [Patescibacteria group bacterium]
MSDIDERSVRIAKAHTIRTLGLDPYPSTVQRTKTCHEARLFFDELSSSHESIHIVGRIRNLRRHGGSAFISVQDETDRLQAYVKKDDVGDKCYAIVKDLLDIGDHVQIEGTLFQTKTGEMTIHATALSIISKALLPLPEQWHGLSDIETRYRQRYLDLIANQDVKDIFQKRSCLMRTIRRYFEEHGFFEVETPILQPLAGGAAAKPFVTHHNALDMDMYLRVAPELYLKRLIIGGYERVYEFARCFRNEGIDHAHNPEFTQIEAYCAYVDYHFLMSFIEALLLSVVRAMHDSDSCIYKDVKLVFGQPFEKLSFRDALLDYAHIDIDRHTSLEDLRREASDRNIDCATYPTKASILDELFKSFVRSSIVQPTFIVDYPIELSPLAKKKADNPNLTERFQLIIAGMEVVNAFSELNDPLDQRERFEVQAMNREMGDEETHGTDYDFVNALEYGMPPTAGFGMGIDRLTALLTNSASLKEVILFPTLRPKAQ